MQQSATKATAKYQRLRSRLIERGINIRRFAIERGYSIPTAYNAARGQRAGITSTKILRELEALANV